MSIQNLSNIALPRGPFTNKIINKLKEKLNMIHTKWEI